MSARIHLRNRARSASDAPTPKKVLILGSGALRIGQAGEFDYSGSQAIKALKEENIEVVLINPNIATVQTNADRADRTYLLPLEPAFIESVIERERPDAVLLSFGGQTALNCGLDLHDRGILKKFGVRVLGTPVEAIRTTEDRELFKKALQKMGVLTPRSEQASTIEQAIRAAKRLQFPVMVRAGFALGGLGSGKASNEKQLRILCQKAFSFAPHVLIEEYLGGWKEIEYEVVRDQFDNCITVCNMENFDPLGIHTGESIVVAPSQTLSDAEYHFLRERSIRVIRGLGIVGECNIQYALDPHSLDYRVIEVNARLSRSSALASKATGYPLAFVAAKLALGHSLLNLPNAVTKTTKAFFEPALDYCVVKIPRWDLQKFVGVDARIGSEMKSVGEIMAIGRSFEEALQKGIRMLHVGMYGLVGNRNDIEKLVRELRHPTDKRLFAIVHAFQTGYSVKRVRKLTQIDPWFLSKIQDIVRIEKKIRENPSLPKDLLILAKQKGFSDKQLALLTNRTHENLVRKKRHALGIRPFIKQIDTLAAEYPSPTNYLYLTYNARTSDVRPLAKNPAIVLGSGPYSIGSSVEFDWCAVSALDALRKRNVPALMINCNPETVSTDFDECPRLYFDELSLESVMEITSFEQSRGVLVSVGGQIPNNLALKLAHNGVSILGTTAQSIDRAENRHAFSKLCDQLGIDQPDWLEAESLSKAEAFADRAGYPVLVRPSYVLSGSAMRVAHTKKELENYLANATRVSPEHPVVISKFIESAKEIEFDGVAAQGKIVVFAISEHVENAGVHSGDATLVLPPQKTYWETKHRLLSIAEKLAESLSISGPFNIQFIAKENRLRVIELNLRASRSFPFVSKVLGTDFVEKSVDAMLSQAPVRVRAQKKVDHVGVKAPFFSFSRLKGADPVLGVEMASTGEVGCLGPSFEDAFLKAAHAQGYRFPIRTLLMDAPDVANMLRMKNELETLSNRARIFVTDAFTKKILAREGIAVRSLPKNPAILSDWVRSEKPDLAISFPKTGSNALKSFPWRRACVDSNTPLVTNVQLARQLLACDQKNKNQAPEIRALQEYLQPQKQKRKKGSGE